MWGGMASRSVKKSARKSATGKPFQKGGDERQGKGPPKGQGGRPPDALKALCRELSDKHKLADIAAKIATDRHQDPRDRLAAIKLLWAYGFGQPTQHVDVTSRHEESIEDLA
jgi:hypothetical protein